MLPSRELGVIRNGLVVLLATSAAVVLLAGPAADASASSALLYNYEFEGADGTVANSAPNGPVAPLSLYGEWQPVPAGVQFAGDTAGQQSVAYGRPTSGNTIDEPPTRSVGVGTRFVYQAPSTGRCFPDTPNITQLGRYYRHETQAKIQLSSCLASQGNVFAECRFAGSLTVRSTGPVISSMALVSGNTYNVTCVKSPDSGNNTTVKLTVTNYGPVEAGSTVTNTFTVAAVGAMKSTEFVSAGNKYPLPEPANNTDQFNGDVTSAVYCSGEQGPVTTCLNATLPSS